MWGMIHFLCHKCLSILGQNERNNLSANDFHDFAIGKNVFPCFGVVKLAKTKKNNDPLKIRMKATQGVSRIQ